MTNTTIIGKKNARKYALQSLYQWLISNDPPAEIEAQFRAINNMTKVDCDYYCKLLYGIPKHVEEIDNAIIPFLDREIKSLNPIELIILRMAGFELLYCLEVPYLVVIDEAVLLTKMFGSKDGHKYVNGVLHNFSQTIRKY